MTMLNATPPQFPDHPRDVPKWQAFKDEFLSHYTVPTRAHATCRGIRYAIRCIEEQGVQSLADLTPATIARLVASRPPTQFTEQHPWIVAVRPGPLQLRGEITFILVSPFRIRPISSFVHRAPARGKKHASREEIRKVLDHMRETSQGRRLEGLEGQASFRTHGDPRVHRHAGGGSIYTCRRPTSISREASSGFVSTSEHRTKTEAAAQPLPIAPPLGLILEEWLRFRMSVPPGFRIDSPTCPWMWPTSRRLANAPWVSGGPGTKPRDRMKAVAAQVGVIGFGPLVLRHSMATHLMTSWGGSAGLVKRVLRHTTEQTQEWYVHDDIPGLKEAFKNVEF